MTTDSGAPNPILHFVHCNHGRTTHDQLNKLLGTLPGVREGEINISTSGEIEMRKIAENLVILSIDVSTLIVNFGRQKLRQTHVQCADYSKTTHLRDYFNLFTSTLQTKLMCHEKNGGIDGRKSRTHVWKLVPTSIAFFPPY